MVGKRRSQVDPGKTLTTDQETELALQHAESCCDDNIQELVQHMDAELVAATTVDKIQGEVKSEHERQYKLERRASAENLAKTQERRASAENLTKTQERIAAANTASKASNSLLTLSTLLQAVLLIAIVVAFYWFIMREATLEVPPPVPTKMCLHKLCVKVPSKLLKRVPKKMLKL